MNDDKTMKSIEYKLDKLSKTMPKTYKKTSDLVNEQTLQVSLFKFIVGIFLMTITATALYLFT